MKKLFIFLFPFSLLIALSLVQFSCSSINRSAVPCPDFSHSRNMKSRHAQVNNGYSGHQERYHANINRVNIPLFKDHSEDFKSRNYTAGFYFAPLNEITGIQAKIPGSYSYSLPVLVQRVNLLMPAERKQIPVSVSQETGQQGCDTIVLRNGDIIQARVIEIGQREIRYKKCENDQGPALVIGLADVFMIKYPNGTRDYFTTEKTTGSSGSNAMPKKMHGMALSGFIGSLVGLFILGIPLGIMAVVFGSVSLGKIDKHPERFKGRGMAIASIIIGAVDIIGMIILLTAM